MTRLSADVLFGVALFTALLLLMRLLFVDAVTPPQHTENGTASVIGSLHCTHFFIRRAQPSHAHMWPHG